VLLLDEPTNDLDVDTLRALEDALLGFSGCVVVISHDRWFLNRIATHMLAFEGDSHIEWFQGNYADYEADLKRRKASTPTSRTGYGFKPLTRMTDAAARRSYQCGADIPRQLLAEMTSSRTKDGLGRHG
jgi:energy-coupling factor transporter ATP-binding protein EcfA2